MNTPDYIMQMLRQQYGLEDNDTSRDASIDALTPKQKLREVLGWEFGDPAWADQFLSWAEDCGFEIKENQDGK